MYRNKILLIKFGKIFTNHLKNKNQGSLFLTRDHCSHRLTSLQFFSFNRTEINGFHKPFTVPQKPKFDSCGKGFAKFTEQKCWMCQQELKLKDFTCVKCGALQYPPETVNYFELFGVSQTYDINLEMLSSKFKKLQMLFHPDKFLNRSKTTDLIFSDKLKAVISYKKLLNLGIKKNDVYTFYTTKELEISEMYSRLLNKAYTTLKNPLLRGFYILDILKVPFEENLPMDQDFLMLIMEKNEELQGITTSNKLEEFLSLNAEDIDKQVKQISEALFYSKFDEARVNLLKLNYFINLEEKIKERKSELNSAKFD